MPSRCARTSTGRSKKCCSPSFSPSWWCCSSSAQSRRHRKEGISQEHIDHAVDIVEGYRCADDLWGIARRKRWRKRAIRLRCPVRQYPLNDSVELRVVAPRCFVRLGAKTGSLASPSESQAPARLEDRQDHREEQQCAG